jgi:hypothetical protein
MATTENEVRLRQEPLCVCQPVATMSQVVPKPKQRRAARGELFPQRSMGSIIFKYTVRVPKGLDVLVTIDMA